MPCFSVCSVPMRERENGFYERENVFYERERTCSMRNRACGEGKGRGEMRGEGKRGERGERGEREDPQSVALLQAMFLSLLMDGVGCRV